MQVHSIKRQYRELFMSSMILSKEGHDFYFIHFLLIQNLFCRWWVGCFISFFPQTLLTFPTLTLVYYCLYFKLYVRRNPLSCQSALSGFGSHLFSPLWEFLLVNFPFILSSYSPFPLMPAFSILNKYEIILKFSFCLYTIFIADAFSSSHSLISKLLQCLKPSFRAN